MVDLIDTVGEGSTSQDAVFMRLALEMAQQAADADEVPVGAVLVNAQGEIVGRGANAVLRRCDPSAHAEIMAMREAGLALNNYRLPDLTLYVTLEPCTMCLGAIFHARIARLVYGASDPKTGACGGRLDLTEKGLINYHCEIEGGVLAEDCAKMLTRFFSQRRQRQAEKKRIEQQRAEQETIPQNPAKS
ncbi:tRNA adenosine(34) deaminase TadA [Orrella sp. 11846]|uniref:tRNA adenosine(34) deaminase TadA n=1 Tax=Orrella sp. 11846 TaxID=3409913 RepID=UPI003B5A115F